MRAWVGYLLLALSLVIAYQAYENTKLDPAMEATARAIACDVDPGCVLKTERPREMRADVFQRRYGWKTTVGHVHVVCRRQLIFFGPWRCESKTGEMGAM